MKHIFVIDDEPEILHMFTSLLEARYRVSSARDGKMALERSGDIRPEKPFLRLA